MKINYLTIVISALLLVACSEKKEPEKVQVRPVKVMTIESTSDLEKNYSGVVEAVTYTNLTFRVSGQIINFPVSSGQLVQKGQLIAELDTRELALQYSADKAAYETALAQYERAKRLVDKEAISMQEFEVNKANYEKTKTAFENSKNNMRDTKLYAPFMGIIEERPLENFERVTSGTTIVKLVDPYELQIDFTVPDNSLYLLQNNPTFTVQFDMIKNKSFKAKLSKYIEVSSDGSGIPVTIKIDDPTFKEANLVVKPGFACTVNMYINTKNFAKDNVLTIPLSAVYPDEANKTSNVWVVKNNVVNLKQIKTSRLIGENSIVVEGGLNSGDIIVIAGVTQLVEGQKVTLIK